MCIRDRCKRCYIWAIEVRSACAPCFVSVPCYVGEQTVLAIVPYFSGTACAGQARSTDSIARFSFVVTVSPYLAFTPI